ncbi:ArsR/SmtB family transcription factor [Undibacterium pigrum]|uniref:ArsR family transcriptional regulator n=1 Tax=Undibacterium pigrum TaxID=401470 RepID=A0A318IRP3_9BURK|nr:winged helix-turn-helix domain-containing protein [Undibacterium pigrum]PXX37320.1 ArsR family transcriptional regulator [Undibacterium pigrum]
MDDAQNISDAIPHIIPRIAALMADPARAAMLWSLIDGTTRPAGELAFAANVSAQSASAHLARLVEGGLLTSQAHGRHRYFRIASAEAASLIESMAVLGAATHTKASRQPPQPALVRSMPKPFLHARTCYDHLAGELAVQLLDAMLTAKWLEADGKDFKPSALGSEKLAALGIARTEHTKSRRIYARCCIDLTQRRPHLAGVLGAELLNMFVREAWILRTPRSRIVSLTPKGQDAIRKIFDV